MKPRTLMALFCALALVNTACAGEIIRQVEFVDAAVLDVVQALAERAGLEVVVAGNSGQLQARRTTLRLQNIGVEEAIGHVLRTSGLSYVKKGNVILIPALQPGQESAAACQVVPLKYVLARKLSQLLEKIFPSLKASVGCSVNSLVLSGSTADLEEALGLIAQMDRPVPQVLIESKVVEITESDSLRLGLSYGKEAGTFKFVTGRTDGRTVPAQDLQTTLNTLISEGRAKVVASPRIATLDDHEAVINIGSRIPYAVPVSSGSTSMQWTVEYIDAGVKLRITPYLGEDGYVTAAIQPEVSSVSEWRATAAGEFPVITTRNARATLRVRDGETIVVGGLLSESERENISRLPVLGYLPLAGVLFQNRTVEKARTEIVFLITPHLI